MVGEMIIMIYGEKVLIPYLLNRRINKIDYIFISHYDNDHVGRIIKNNGKIRGKKYNDRNAI